MPQSATTSGSHQIIAASEVQLAPAHLPSQKLKRKLHEPRWLPLITRPPALQTIVVTGGSLKMSGTLHRVDGFFYDGNVLYLVVSANCPPCIQQSAKPSTFTRANGNVLYLEHSANCPLCK